LKLSPNVAILLNIDKDHMECYPNVDALTDVFYQFCKQAKVAFVCADDERCTKFEKFPTFGISNPLSDYRAVQIRGNGERYSFVVEEYGRAICRIRLKTIGYCNIYNALAAFAAMRSFGFEEKEICKGIENFTAVKRRFEKIGSYKGASIICDYADHPREIKSTLHTAKGICKGTLYVVFQPHTYSRTKLLMEEFIEVLRMIKNLIIYKTYPARERYDEEGSAERLAKEVGDCLYIENVHVLKTWLRKTAQEGDIVLFLGAGDIYYLTQYLLKELN
jgi:UDP-N-acetylmuramate--alanine ligase